MTDEFVMHQVYLTLLTIHGIQIAFRGWFRKLTVRSTCGVILKSWRTESRSRASSVKSDKTRTRSTYESSTIAMTIRGVTREG